MTTTIKNIGDSNDVDIATWQAADKSLYVIVPSDPPKGEAREALLQKTAGDKDFPSTTRVGWYPNRAANGGVGQTNISVKTRTFVQETDAEGNVVWTLPLTVTTAISAPGNSGIPDSEDMLELIMNNASWLIQVIAGVADDAALEQLEFGVVNGLQDLTDTASA